MLRSSSFTAGSVSFSARRRQLPASCSHSITPITTTPHMLCAASEYRRPGKNEGTTRHFCADVERRRRTCGGLTRSHQAADSTLDRHPFVLQTVAYTLHLPMKGIRQTEAFSEWLRNLS